MNTVVSIGLQPNGLNRVQLVAGVGNDMQVTWTLTDDQLAFLVAQGVSILENRYRTKTMDAEIAKIKILELFNPKD